MTRIDFYLNAPSKLKVACSIVTKAFLQRMRVMVLAPDDMVARAIDKLMWTAPTTGFIPHCMTTDRLAIRTPVIISRDTTLTMHDELMINLGDIPPANFSRFQRLFEIVSTEEPDRIAARERYRFYNARGYGLVYHDLATIRTRETGSDE
jgi:DNA polymerase III subunit chi